ncbi:hypothetical protein FHG87_002143 [Trinorchestia longiramus]|nr:hypothetical protein FHG87_002143 [Trinorchestia longiramus]
MPSVASPTNPEPSSTNTSNLGLQRAPNSQTASRAAAHDLQDRRVSSNTPLEVESPQGSQQNWRRPTNLHPTHNRTRMGFQENRRRSSSPSWRNERVRDEFRGQAECLTDVSENTAQNRRNQEHDDSLRYSNEFKEQHDRSAGIHNRGGHGDESLSHDDSTCAKETKDSKPIDVLQLFNIANECGGAVSYSLGKIPVMDNAVLLTSLEAPQLEKASLLPSVPDKQRKDSSEGTKTDRQQSISSSASQPGSPTRTVVHNSSWYREASNDDSFFYSKETISSSGSTSQALPDSKNVAPVNQSSECVVETLECPPSGNSTDGSHLLDLEAVEESALPYTTYNYSKAAPQIEIPSSFQQKTNFVSPPKSDVPVIGPPPGFLGHPRAQNSMSLQNTSSSAPIMKAESQDSSNGTGEEETNAYPAGEGAAVALPVHRSRPGLSFASQQPRFQFPPSGPESPALNGSPNLSSAAGTALGSPGIAMNAAGLPFNPLRMSMPLNVSGMALNSGDLPPSYAGISLNSVGGSASTGMSFPSAGVIASSTSVRTTTTVTPSPPVICQQQSIANFYPQLIQGPIPAVNPNSAAFGMPPWRHMSMQQILLQRPLSSGTESGQQQQHALTYQQFQNPQQMISTQGLPSSSASQQQLPGSGLRNSVFMPVSSSLQQGTTQQHQQRLNNPPQQFMNTGMPFIGSTPQPFMNSFQNIGVTQNGTGASLAFVNSSGQYVASPPPPQGFMSPGSQSPANYPAQQVGAISQDFGTTARQPPANSSQAFYGPVLHPISVQQPRHLSGQLGNKSVHYPPSNIVFMPTVGAPGPMYMGSTPDNSSAAPVVSYSS